MKILLATIFVLALSGPARIVERLHSVHHIEEDDFETHTHVHDAEFSEEKYTNMMHSLLNLNEKEVLGCKKSNFHDFWQFSFQTAGKFSTDSANTQTLTSFEDDCYESMTVTQKYNPLLKRWSVTFAPGARKLSDHCTETYLVGTTMNYNIVTVNGKPHTVHFTLLTHSEQEAYKWAGLYIFRTCDYFDNWLGDFLTTVELFFGGFTSHPKWGPVLGSKPAPWMVRSNIEFIEKATGYRWEERKINNLIDLSEDEVGNGDFLAITRFDGLDQIIEWGTGSHSGHSAVIFKFDGETYVVESQDGWYWPKGGIQRNKWSVWKEWAVNAGFNVVVLPLSAESKAKWNQEAAENWFKYMEGFPYGYHNFIFGWLDVPVGNFPPALSHELAMHIFAFAEKIAPAPIVQLVGEGLNKRLGTEGLTLNQIAIEAGKRGISLPDLFSIVEQDDWIYSDGPSYVCSCLAAGLYKAAGLLGDVQATEFTPKDIYQLAIYDSEYKVPEKCLRQDPDLPYCQIMGTHRMRLPGYNTIVPYDHMNEHCPSANRPDGC